MAFAQFLLALKTIKILRINNKFGYLIEMLLRTMIVVVPFIIVTVICVIAFADAFNALKHGKSIETAS